MNFFNDIRTEIAFRYTDPVKRDLAEQSLILGEKWVDMNSSMLKDKPSKIKCRRECSKYISSNINRDRAKQKYGSIILLMVIGAVIAWVVKRILDRLFPA